MQIIWAVDAVNTTQRIWINGVEETLSSSLNPPNYAYGMNESGNEVRLGCQPWETANHSFDGYIAQFVHLDGQYITDPTEFGQVSTTSGEWEPIEITSSSFTYGTNGALLLFEDPHIIGRDSAGGGVGRDNYCTFNPDDESAALTYTIDNTRIIWSDTDYCRTRGTTGVSSGKWYFEFMQDGVAQNGNTMIWGVKTSDVTLTTDSFGYGSAMADEWVLTDMGAVANDGSGTADVLSDPQDGDIIQVAVDMDAKKIWFGVNDTWDGDPAAGTGIVMIIYRTALSL